MGTEKARDGTPIAYDEQGWGRTVILVDGALGYRRFGAASTLAKLLAPRFRVITYDRRGRGESGDTQPYALGREIDDLEALIASSGGSASLYGISSGDCLELEAALSLGGQVERLALYEPPYNGDASERKEWQDYDRELTTLLTEGRHDEALALFMGFLGAPAEMIEQMRQSPVWPTMVAVAPTLAYDKAAIGPDRKVPTDRAGQLTIPTLVMNGSLTLPFIQDAATALAAALPQGRHLILEGQRHDVSPDVLAPILTDFFAEAEHDR